MAMDFLKLEQFDVASRYLAMIQHVEPHGNVARQARERIILVPWKG